MTERKKCALITGAAGGIGRAAARHLANDGWRVALSYRGSPERVSALSEELKSLGGETLMMETDLAHSDEVRALEADLAEKWGGVDALIHAAGSFRRVDVLQETAEHWRASFEDNLHSAFYLSQALAPGMQRRGWGRLIFFSLVNADYGTAQPMITAHYLAKSSLSLLASALAKRLAGDGITVNTLALGLIDTDNSTLEQLPTSRVPAGRLGTPEDLLGALTFLLSNEAAYVTGASLRISGGWGL